jgi:restriction endonuclease Mrr
MKPKSKFYASVDDENKINIEEDEPSERIQQEFKALRDQINSLNLSNDYDLDPHELETILDSALTKAQSSPYFNLWAHRQVMNERLDELLDKDEEVANEPME